MKICYRTEMGGVESRYRMKGFALVGLPVFCCQKMENEWGQLIDLGVRGFSRPENIGCYLCTHHLLSDHLIVAGLDLIHHCPWCGEAIELAERASSFADATFPEDF